MKSRTFILGMALALVLAIGIPPVQGGFYVIPSARGVGTPITSVPYTISEPGLYYLKQNLTYTAMTGAAITVEADDVTIDLMGFTITGPGADTGTNHGIYMYRRSNVEIRNGTLRGFGYHGIGEAGAGAARQHIITNVRAVGNGWDGIRLAGYGHLVQNCTASENGAHSVGTAWGHGIGVGDGCSVLDCTAYYNTHSGIYVGIGGTVSRNTVYRNQYHGIELGMGTTLTGNTARWNKSYGFYGKLGCTLTGNTATWNDASGFYVPSGSTVVGNTAYNNKQYGFHFGGGNCLVDQNTAYDNDMSGGGYPNFSSCSPCTLGLNHAP